MNGYIVSVLMGLAVGVAYGHVARFASSRWSAYWQGGSRWSTWRDTTSCGPPAADLPSRSYCNVARGCRGGMTHREIWLSMRAR